MSQVVKAMMNIYADLEDEGWSIVPGSMDRISYQHASVSKEGLLERLRLFSIKGGNYDMECLDIGCAGSYLRHLLYWYGKEKQWHLYREVYSLGMKIYSDMINSDHARVLVCPAVLLGSTLASFEEICRKH